MSRANESKLSARGRITIPKSVRQHLDLKPGSRIKFFFHPDGGVAILAKIPVSALKGIVPLRRKLPATLEEMDRAIAAAVARRFTRADRSPGP